MDSSASPTLALYLLQQYIKSHVTTFLLSHVPVQNTLSFRTRPMQGLPNIGNTCFLNATFAALYYTYTDDEFTRILTSGPISDLMSEFMNLYQLEENLRNWVWRLLGHFDDFRDGKHHCAASFLLHLLQALDKEAGDCEPVAVLAISPFVRGKRNRALHEMFSVVQTNAFTCAICGTSQESQMYSRVLALPIPTNYDDNVSVFFNETDFFSSIAYQLYESSRENYYDALNDIAQNSERSKLRYRPKVDLRTCFQYQCRAHVMQGPNRLDCETCGRLEKHYKQSFLTHIGSTLVLHLQRYNQTTGEKLETQVSAPSEELDLRDFGSFLGKYQLKAVICHYGNMHFGHYTANVKTEGGWWRLSDSHIEQISPATVYDHAILLYYRQLRN